MKFTKTVTTALCCALLLSCNHGTRVPLAEDTSVWGGRIKDGSLMPYAAGFTADLSDNRSNQVAPLLLLSDGRFVWSEEPFSFVITDRAILIDGNVEVVKAGDDLAGAYRAAAREHFPADDGTVLSGGTYAIDVPIDRLPVFERLQPTRHTNADAQD